MTAPLQNASLMIQAAKGVIPDLAKGGREAMVGLAQFFNSLALGMAAGGPGEARALVIPGSTNAAYAHSTALITLASAVAGTVIEINGTKFTAISGTPVVANNEFDISGADIADATSLCAAIVNAASGIATTVAACNLATTIALASVAVGDSVVINGITLTAVSGVRDNFNTFDVSGSDTADCQALAACIAAHPTLKHQFIGTNSAGAAVDSSTVYLRQKTGTVGLSLATPSATITLGAAAPVATAIILLTSKDAGTIGNSVTVKTLGVAASTTLTVTAPVVTDTVLINGTTLTAIKQRATATLTLTSVLAADSVVINGVTFTAQTGASGVGFPTKFDRTGTDTQAATDLTTQINAYPAFSGLFTATSSSGVVTLRAVTSGTAGNSYTLVSNSATIVASAATLTGGIAVANNQFDVSPGATATQIATDLARCINASTTALVSSSVRATSNAAVVTVYSLFPGIPGNAITTSTTGGQIAAGAARLIGGTTAEAEGAAAAGTITITGGSGNYTATINGVATGNVAWATSDTVTATALAAAINALSTLAADHVHATSSGTVVTVTASRGGILGNCITLACTGTGAVASGARLTGGAAPLTVVPSAARLSGGVGGDGTAAVFNS